MLGQASYAASGLRSPILPPILSEMKGSTVAPPRRVIPQAIVSPSYRQIQTIHAVNQIPSIHHRHTVIAMIKGVCLFCKFSICDTPQRRSLPQYPGRFMVRKEGV